MMHLCCECGLSHVQNIEQHLKSKSKTPGKCLGQFLYERISLYDVKSSSGCVTSTVHWQSEVVS